jgi:PAS domain S-box-containing protein
LENRLTWNSKLFQLLGLDPHAEANYDNWRSRIYPDDLERVETAINQAIENQTDYDAEHRVIHPDGTILWIIARGRAIYNQSGRPLRMLGVAIDITDRKQAEISLQESEERFRSAIVNSPLPIMLHAEDGEVLQINHAWTEISGYSSEEIPTIADWTHKAYNSGRELVLADIQRLYNLDRRVSEGEYTIRTRSGETRIWDFYSAPLGKLPDGRSLVISTAIDITERKRAEADLQQYKDIFQFSEHGLAVGKGLLMEIVNPAFARMHGYSVEEMIGKPILSLFPSSCWAETVSFMQDLNEVGHLTHESYHLRKDGTTFPIFLDVTMVKDPEGNPLYRIVTLLDITDRKRAETALKESEERLRLALQAANQGLWDLNIQTGEAIVSAEYARMLGYEPEEFQETNAKWKERLHPEERETVYQLFADYIAGKRDDYRVECRQKTKTGEWKWILSVGKVVEWDESGKPVRMLGTHTDISDRKRAELALLASETQLRSILENMPVMLDSFDAQGNIIVWNQECERVTGYSAEEVIGNPQIWEMLYPDPIYRQEMLVNWAEKGNNYRNWEWNLVTRNGETKTIAWSNISDIFPVPGWASWGVGIDISDRKQAELKVIQLNQTLEERVKERTAELAAANKELSAFSYSVSHDLRAPLRGIDGFSKVLLERYANQLDEQGKHYLDRIRAGTQRMGELIEDMLMLSRVTRAEMKRNSVNLSALAQEISENLSESQPERSVTWKIAPEITVLGDGALLRIVLENLLSNAWKFTSTRTQTEIEFSLTILPENTQAYFVKDNGVGFDMNYVNKLFIAFQRLHSTNEFPGTGVGLAIVQRIIHRHGGKVWAEGIIDRGAAFYFTLG